MCFVYQNLGDKFEATSWGYPQTPFIIGSDLELLTGFDQQTSWAQTSYKWIEL